MIVIFFSDLDNTILFSKKYHLQNAVCVEYLKGERQGFLSKHTIEKLTKISKKAIFIPVTTRSIAQYSRILWPKSCLPHWAITTNGGNLLIDGKADKLWQLESTKLISIANQELKYIQKYYEKDERFSSCRIVDDTYLLLIPFDNKDINSIVHEIAKQTFLKVQYSGRKIYLIPREINKGAACKRFIQRFFQKKEIKILAAGDSEMDLPLLSIADYAFYDTTTIIHNSKADVMVGPLKENFPNWFLGEIEKIIEAIC